MKVIFPITKFYPVQSGGPIYTLLWHCEALNSNGIEVKIYTSTSGFDSIKTKVPKTDTYLKTSMGEIIYRSGSLAIFKNIKTILNEVKSDDIVHLNSFFSPISFLTFLALKMFKKNTNIIWSVRGEFNKNAISINKLKKLPILTLIRSRIDNTIFHSTSSQETNDILNQFENAKIIKIPNLINFQPKLNYPKKKEIIFVGRIHPIKNIENLIEAIHLSREFKLHNYKLKIIGKYESRHTSYYNNLKKMVLSYNLSNYVQFIDHIVGEEKWKAYSEAMFLCLPSKTENFGNVVVEALSQGTPVIASLGTPWESLNNEKAGFHVSNTAQSLANTLKIILELSKEDYEIYSNNALKLCRSNYDIKLNINLWEEVYKNCK